MSAYDTRQLIFSLIIVVGSGPLGSRPVCRVVLCRVWWLFVLPAVLDVPWEILWAIVISRHCERRTVESRVLDRGPPLLAADIAAVEGS